MDGARTIGQVAQATGVSAKTIRYYEQVGVLPIAGRTPAGYRQYTQSGVDRLLFIRRARALGLSLRHARALSAALDGPRGAVRPQLRQLVRTQLAAVKQRAVELEGLQRHLERVLHRLSSPARRHRSERCRCLDADGA